jgi:hypothetical protein
MIDSDKEGSETPLHLGSQLCCRVYQNSSLSLFLSLSLSLSLTCWPERLSLSLSLSMYLSIYLSRTHTLAHTHIGNTSLSLPHTHTHTCWPERLMISFTLYESHYFVCLHALSSPRMHTSIAATCAEAMNVNSCLQKCTPFRAEWFMCSRAALSYVSEKSSSSGFHNTCVHTHVFTLVWYICNVNIFAQTSNESCIHKNMTVTLTMTWA